MSKTTYKEAFEKFEELGAKKERIEMAMDLMSITMEDDEPAFNVDWIIENILGVDVNKQSDNS